MENILIVSSYCMLWIIIDIMYIAMIFCSECDEYNCGGLFVEDGLN